jgi:DNA-binding MarR family transcriptional regulator
MANLGVSVTALHLAVQSLLVDELTRRGHPDVQARHGAVLAHVGDGARATDLSARSARSKQTVTRLIDELEQLGYVERQPDPQDRRGKIVVLTDFGAAEVRAAREILAELEQSCSAAVGAEAFTAWMATTTRLVEHLAGPKDDPLAAPGHGEEPEARA